MKTILFATAIILMPVGAVFAADINQTLPAATYNWSGAYIGAQAGYAWGDGRVGLNSNPNYYDNFGWDYSLSGGFGGLYAGYNHQFDGGVVLGVEGDYNFASLKDDALYQAMGVDLPNMGGVLELHSVGSIRLRAGYAMDRWLPFVTGGLAVATYEHTTVHLPGGAPFGIAKDTITGYTLGAGAEYAVTDNWVVRGEYRFADFGRQSSVRQVVGGGSAYNPDEIELTTHDIRVGVAYKF
ncbi:porin family protein [Mesorhizobium sp. PAMC28654]|uniref:outer membrane protein n=1 Tax=Mesorhizobium sp. PAMC28654 TaxID=2880934 RepID=UPI001D0A04B0|nr:outer membrane protein [Mesorhizobium sp. PAMC28654]UDL89453.1 porin family protein [Mesorhizobium sp. PAMC28654]